MEQIETLTIPNGAANAAADASAIPPLSHGESAAMATDELERFLALLDELRPEDWSKPTACTRWDVRQIVAHLAGVAHAYSTFSEFRRQGNGRLQLPYRRAGMSRLDAMNQIPVDDRAGRTPAQLMAELRERAPRAIRSRGRLPALLRHLPLPLGKITPEIGRTWVQVGYLTDLILTRDMWMHRHHIGASGQPIVLGHRAHSRISPCHRSRTNQLRHAQAPQRDSTYERSSRRARVVPACRGTAQPPRRGIHRHADLAR